MSSPSLPSESRLSPLHLLLSSTKAAELVSTSVYRSIPPSAAATHSFAPPQRPVCLDADLSVQEGCAALAAYKISSAPVYDHRLGGFVGMLDYRDLVTFVLEVFHKIPKTAPPAVDSEWEITDIVKRAVGDRQGVPIKLVSNLSQRNPLVSIAADASLLDAIKEFATSGVHRLVVLLPPEGGTEGGSRFVGVLSQSTVAAFIAANLGKLAGKDSQLLRSLSSSEVVTPALAEAAAKVGWPVGTRTLAELGFVHTRPTIHITMQASLLDALYQMHQHDLTSIAIVDTTPGYLHLTGSITMTDIKSVLAEKAGFRKLYDNAFRFFATLRATQGLEAGGNDRAPVFVVHPNTTLLAAVEKMAATRTHRYWIVEGPEKLVGVVSLSDVMALLQDA
ncbi:hypothetical protein BJ742DRAFT_848873 [Cladochytrium replicatum]|nr:hypothetical protein BJ742DRAFT_848873 [Cladochytrium replicatum]